MFLLFAQASSGSGPLGAVVRLVTEETFALLFLMGSVGFLYLIWAVLRDER